MRVAVQMLLATIPLMLMESPILSFSNVIAVAVDVVLALYMKRVLSVVVMRTS